MPPKLKNDLGTFFVPIVIVIGMPLGIHFTTPENCLFYHKYEAKCLFLLPKSSYSGTKFHLRFDVVRVSCWDTLFSSFFKHDTQYHDLGTPFGIQLGSKMASKSAKWLNKRKKHPVSSLWGVLEPIFSPQRLRLNLWWFLVDLWSIWDCFFAVLSDLLMDLLLFCAPFQNRFLQMIFLKFTAGKQGAEKNHARSCQDMPRSAIIQGQPNEPQA